MDQLTTDRQRLRDYLLSIDLPIECICPHGDGSLPVACQHVQDMHWEGLEMVAAGDTCHEWAADLLDAWPAWYRDRDPPLERARSFPGDAKRVEEYRSRRERGFGLWHPGDPNSEADMERFGVRPIIPANGAFQRGEILLQQGASHG